MRAVGAVVKKELADALRDRRSVGASFVWPILGPLMVAMMFGYIAKRRDQDRPLELPVVGRANAPSLVGWLEQQGVKVQPPPDDPEAKVREGDLDVVLVIPEDYGKDFRAGRPAAVQLILDDSRDKARASIRRVRQLLQRYSGQIGSLRLLARGISPDVARALDIQDLDMATPQRMAAQILSMVPYFVMLVAFMGGMNVAIDTTAGERERGSLEPLLINPITPLALVTGKWIVVSLFNATTTLLQLFVFRLALDRTPLQALDVFVKLEAHQIVTMMLALTPLALFAAALLMCVATMARTFKEAQTYLSLLVLVPMLPSIVLMLNPLKPALWMMLIPTFGQNLLLHGLIRGDTTPASHLLVAGGSCLLLAAGLLVANAALLRRERIVFGR